MISCLAGNVRRWGRQTWWLASLAALSLHWIGSARADDQVRRVQEELRRRNLYFGQVDGRETEEVRTALRRYQERKGFAATGSMEQESLASLGVVAPQAAEATLTAGLPEGPVLKNDFPRELTAAEKEQAEKTAGEPAPIADAPPDPAEPIRNEEIPRGIAPPQSPPRATPAAETFREAVERFVRQYLDACETNNLAKEMGYYAPEMRYFDYGMKRLDFVEADVRRYYKRWPKRQYTLVSLTVQPRGDSGHDFTARFRIRFHLSNESAKAVGQTDNVFGVRAEGAAWKFISLQEARVRS